MTNHIEQMMKVAGVKPRFYMEVNVGDLDCNFQEVSEKTVKKLWENWGFHLQCSDYWMEDEEAESIPENFEDFKRSDFWEKKYPPFTPAKQLELIKLIADFHCFKDLNGFWNMTSVDMGKHQIYSLCCEKSFEDSLAEFTTHLIARITIDKAEVKRILEDD